MNAPTFENRWLIIGTLITRSPLHIGDGGRGELLDRTRSADKNKMDDDKEHDASTVCVDDRGRAYIPGSSIKGVLREPLSTPDPNTLEGRIASGWKELFGSDSPDEPGACGGILEFWNAYHIRGDGEPANQPRPDALHLEPDRERPWWDDNRKTCLRVPNSRSRRTNTSMENLLFHTEYVPSGEVFQFEIGGTNIAKKEIENLIRHLGGFNTRRITLGSNGANRWGEVDCEITWVGCFTAGDLPKWKENPIPLIEFLRDHQKPTPISVADAKKLLKEPCTEDPSPARSLRIDVRLSFDTEWLIADPRQSDRKDHGKALPQGEKPSDAVPVRAIGGGFPVTEESFRGAIRARAEAILRTLGVPGVEDHPSLIPPLSAKRGRASKPVADAVFRVAQMSDLVAKLIGFSGWKAPAEISPLVPTGEQNGETLHREFNAIDRFKGGGADGKKFNAETVPPTPEGAALVGAITIRMDRLERVDRQGASLGLLALVLRDLAQGTIPIGAKSAIGFGNCRAQVLWDGKEISDPGCGAATYLKAFHDFLKTPDAPATPSAAPDQNTTR